MKFGKTLLSNQVPEWSRNYISYKSLKQDIKNVTSELPASEEVITSIFFRLDRELEKINTFFLYKQSFIHRRLWILQEKYEKFNDERENIILALKDTKTQMDKLQWFSELNSKGFRKILKKLDKKLELDTQNVYWETKVSVLSFASPLKIRQEISQINEKISYLTSLSMDEPIEVKSSNSSSMKLARFRLRNEYISKAIREDNKKELEGLIKEGMKFESTILELAIEHESIECLKFLVIFLGLSLADDTDINERSLLHRVCLHKNPSLKIAECLLSIEPTLQIKKDFIGRRPLHYATESNNEDLVSLLLKHAIDQEYYSFEKGFANQEWQDREGLNPLFFGIIHGCTSSVKRIIELGQIHDIDGLSISNQTTNTAHEESFIISNNSENKEVEYLPDYSTSFYHPSSIALACKLKNLDLLKLLISKGASVDLADDYGETPLMFAIRSNFIEGVEVLIKEGNVNVNLAENINKWTPLMVASIEGFKDIVLVLLEAGANVDAIDNDKWTALDHAVFRGYLNISKLVKPTNYTLYLDSNTKNKLSDDESNSQKIKQSKFVSKASRLYGHKYLTDLSMIIITLGSNDVRNPLCHKFIDLFEKFQNKDDSRRLSLSVTATNASGEFPIIDLPSDFSQPFYPDPIIIFTLKPEEVVLRFDVIETFGSSHNSSVLARGTSVLAGDSIFTKSKGFKGPTEKASLRGQQTVPLVQAKDLDCVGTLGIEYFVVTPFKHDNMKVGDHYTYYKSVNTKIIGHRGSGMNRKGSKLQVGENTVLSFVTAASLGAEYIEFDVQLTKDLVPVIYHDWTVTETGYDIPLNSITAEQFLNLRGSGYIKEYHTGVSEGGRGIIIPISEEKKKNLFDVSRSSQTENNKDQLKNSKRPNRARSYSSSDSIRFEMNDPFEQTRTSKSGKMKGNGPETIQGPFTTLAETLKLVPKTVGFNIEVKYPMVDEAEEDELTQFQELNIYVDSILDCIYDNVDQDRHIIFSSFHPEICLALNMKQPNYPVFFLTDAGTFPMADIRCNSLQGAVRFAKQAELLGIVAASEPILEAPRLVQVIKAMGLLLFTYGILNNEVEHAIAQKSYGVDAVIVDSVLPVRKGLRGD